MAIPGGGSGANVTKARVSVGVRGQMGGLEKKVYMKVREKVSSSALWQEPWTVTLDVDSAFSPAAS